MCDNCICESTFRKEALSALKDLASSLRDIRDALYFDSQATTLRFTATYPGDKVPHEGVTMVTLTDIQSVKLAIQPVSAKGNPARVDGAPVWEVSDAALLEVTVAVDGLSAVVKALGPVGAAQVKVTADADLGEGVKPLVGILDVEVIASEAAQLVINPDVPY